MYVPGMYVCIFIKLHITAQSGPVIRVILCYSQPVVLKVVPVTGAAFLQVTMNQLMKVGLSRWPENNEQA